MAIKTPNPGAPPRSSRSIKGTPNPGGTPPRTPIKDKPTNWNAVGPGTWGKKGSALGAKVIQGDNHGNQRGR